MDPIADLLTRIKNAYLAHHQELTCPISKQKLALLVLLKKAGYIKDFSSKDRTITIKLAYNRNQPVITHIKRLSKPGCRFYVKSNQIKPVLSGHGHQIISTSKGLMFAKDAKEKNLGGELICELW